MAVSPARSLDAALTAYRQGDHDKALAMARKAAVAKGEAGVMAQALIGNILVKRGDEAGAAAAFATAGRASGEPEKAAGFLKLAATLYDKAGLFDAFRQVGLQAALANRQDSAFVYLMALKLLGPWDEEGKAAMRALIDYFEPTNPEAQFFAARFCRSTGDYARLQALLERARATFPDNVPLEAIRFIAAHDMCDMETIGRHIAMMQTPEDPYARALLQAEEILYRVMWCDDPALFAEPSLESRMIAMNAPPQPPPRRAIAPEGARLKIGYLSSDFFSHATMTLFLDSLIAHDRARFDITLFCHTAEDKAGRLPGPLREDVVRIAHLDDRQAAMEIDRRGIDILVDLKGHTAGARLQIVNLSTAPVKATYLGFPGPVNGVDLDYVIADPIVAPDENQPYFKERFCRLPECYQANSTTSRPRPRPDRRAAHGLPEEAFVFASFNGVQKITPLTLDLWARVMKAAPEALMWILCPHDFVRERLRHEMAARGISPERLIFADRMDYGEHTCRLPLADLALDSFPCNGHTTTSDMLWAGLPVLTRTGRSFSARVSESLLRAVGLPELVTRDDDAFVAMAARLARNGGELAALRQKLSTAITQEPLFETLRFTRHLERAYEMMAARARAGLAPALIDVPALPKGQGGQGVPRGK
ncbi:hypothetical protein ACQ3G6_05095 [Allorhizobium undicola]|uniref:O-linked N-acetylglucosamine transferase, SPINDLY family protein n=1 Tax=Allorhizobium undicola TaxID=78527 RepID=UPI003D334525